MKSELGTVRDACFGVDLQQQGRGFYVTMELLGIVRGTWELGHELLASDMSGVRFERHSHDAARQLAVQNYERFSPDDIDALGGKEIASLLGRLFRSLTISVPGRRRTDLPWQQIYLLPYAGELIHWDAVEVEGKISIEEYSFRGVGAYAHLLLRTDPDSSRLDATRNELTALIQNGSGPLNVIADLTRRRDHKPATKALISRYEPDLDLPLETPWVEILRSGTNNILCRRLPREKRIEMLLHWIPYVMARHFLSVAAVRTGRKPPTLANDFSEGPSPVRSLARRHYKDATALMVEAMDRTARSLGIWQNMAESDRRGKWAPVRSFFTGTMSMIGGLNAPTGSQHLTLGLALLEALAAGCIAPRQQMELGDLCEMFADRLDLVVDQESASKADFLQYANASDFHRNADLLADRLSALGLLEHYSDSTRMVSIPEAGFSS